eukprot:2747098-Prymnesium_polylepis.1
MLNRADVRAARLRPDVCRASPSRLVAHTPTGTPERRPHHRGVAAGATAGRAGHTQRRGRRPGRVPGRLAVVAARGLRWAAHLGDGGLPLRTGASGRRRHTMGGS